MKRLAGIVLIVTWFSHSSFSQTEEETLASAHALVEQKKYESAFQMLETFDAEAKSINVLLLKEEIALKYFVTSIMHTMFSFKDLEPDEDIMDYRGLEGTSNLHVFDIAEELNKFLESNPNHCLLNKGLADYYFDVHMRYGASAMEEEYAMLETIKSAYTVAVKGGCADYMSHYSLAYLFLIDDQLEEAKPGLLESIRLNPEYASAHYNLAYCYYLLEDFASALTYCKKALDLYTEAVYKSDAARLTGDILWAMEDNDGAMRHFRMADEIEPGNHFNRMRILHLSVETQSEEVESALQWFWELAPEEPSTYFDLIEIYSQYQLEAELETFLLTKVLANEDNDEISGALQFFLGRLSSEKNKSEAEKHFNQAKVHFNKFLSSDDPVFSVIQEEIDALKK
ncbi:MAG: tetratricopeptide repeat protein [Flavobacteriales bacterium]|nr:tetratricopeptide repeat protein [Flavobacteriales bacterium]